MVRKNLCIIALAIVSLANSLQAMERRDYTAMWREQTPSYAQKRAQQAAYRQPISSSPSLWQRLKANTQDWWNNPHKDYVAQDKKKLDKEYYNFLHYEQKKNRKDAEKWQPYKEIMTEGITSSPKFQQLNLQEQEMILREIPKLPWMDRYSRRRNDELSTEKFYKMYNFIPSVERQEQRWPTHVNPYGTVNPYNPYE